MFDPRVHVGTAALLTRTTISGEEVLLIHRGANATHGANSWGLPGGWIDWGQTPEEAAARELLEEVNVRVDASLGVIVGAVADTWENQGAANEGMHNVCVAVKFDEFNDDELANLEPEKCDYISWVPVKDIGDLELFRPLRSLAKQWGWL